MAGARRRHRNQLSDSQTGHALPQTGDVPGNFMAENHWLLQPNGSEAAVIVVVKVGSADASSGHANLDLARARFLGRPVLNPKIHC